MPACGKPCTLTRTPAGRHDWPHTQDAADDHGTPAEEVVTRPDELGETGRFLIFGRKCHTNPQLEWQSGTTR